VDVGYPCLSCDIPLHLLGLTATASFTYIFGSSPKTVMGLRGFSSMS
jgi:hypothetical protein